VRLQQNELRFFLSELFSTNTPKSAAYAQEERPSAPPVQRCAGVVHTMFNTTSGGGVEHVQHHF